MPARRAVAKINKLDPVQLRRSHDAMARFLLSMLRHSDEQEDAGCPRLAGAENQYQEALRLLRRAGLEYKRAPKVEDNSHGN